MNIAEAAKSIVNCKNFKIDFSIFTLLSIVFFILLFVLESPINQSNKYSLPIEVFLCIFYVFYLGYYTLTIRNSILTNSNFLPMWHNDIKSIFIQGFKLTLGIIFYASLIGIYYLIINIMYFHTSLFFSPQMKMFFNINIIVLFLIVLVFTPAIAISYCSNLKFSSIFNLKQIFKIIGAEKFEYFKALIFICLLSTLINIIYKLFSTNLVITIIISVISAYAAIFSAVLYGNVYRTMIERHKNNQIEEETTP